MYWGLFYLIVIIFPVFDCEYIWSCSIWMCRSHRFYNFIFRLYLRLLQKINDYKHVYIYIKIQMHINLVFRSLNGFNSCPKTVTVNMPKKWASNNKPKTKRTNPCLKIFWQEMHQFDCVDKSCILRWEVYKLSDSGTNRRAQKQNV